MCGGEQGGGEVHLPPGEGRGEVPVHSGLFLGHGLQWAQGGHQASPGHPHPQGRGKCIVTDTTVYREGRCFCAPGWQVTGTTSKLSLYQNNKLEV